VVEHRLTCEHTVETKDEFGHITCADCDRVRPQPILRITDVADLHLTWVHPESACAGQSACPLHNPSDHHMRGWEVVWRDDRGILERLCPHGIGHPDPDQFPYWDANGMEAEGVHGCDLCCKPHHGGNWPAVAAELGVKMPGQRAI
jgi:hypothetical protein